jgi:hypothetical protein
MRSRTRWPVLVAAGAVVAFAVVAVLVFAEKSSGNANPRQPGRYARLAVPGTQTVVLPQGTVDLSLQSAHVPGSLTVTVAQPADGAPQPTVTRDLGPTFTAGGRSYRRVWKVRVPVAEAYRVTVAGPGTAAAPLWLDVGR